MRGKQRPSRLAPILCLIVPLLGAPFQQPPAKPSGQETLEYIIEWRLVNAGRAKMTMAPIAGENKTGREMKLHLESTGLVSRLFHVNDDYTASSSENFCTESTLMSAREAGRERETRVAYDSHAGKAFFREHDLTKNTVKTAETEIPGCVHDVISGLNYLRTVPVEPGKSISLPVSNGKKSVMLKIECQRREEIKTPLGPRKTLLYEIFAFNNVLYQRPGHIHVWLTDDARRVPVQIEIRLQFTIGTITLRLDKEDKS